MGKPDKPRRGQKPSPRADARLISKDGKPRHAAPTSIVGQLSPDLISLDFAPELTARATDSLERFSDEWMQYEDQLKKYEAKVARDAASEAEINPDGTVQVPVSDEEDFVRPIPPKKPLYRSEYWVKELKEVLTDTSEHFQSKNGAWKIHARAARAERLMEERYGRLRPLIKEYPQLEQVVRTLQRKYSTGYFSPFRQGKAPIPKTTAVIILFMMQRGNLRWEITALSVLFLLVGLQPWALVVLVAGSHALLENRRRKPLKPMKRRIPATSPYYAVEVDDENQNDVDKEKEKKRKIELLKQPVGSKLGLDEMIDTSLYDTILLGSGPSTLYTAALLSRSGRKVLVLSPKEDASGCYGLDMPNVSKEIRDIPFDVESSNVSKCSRQQVLLAPALCSSNDYQGGIRFAQIGSKLDGYAFEILSVPGMGTEGGKEGIPFVLRAGGSGSLVEDAAIHLGDGWPGVTPGDLGNSTSAVYLGICEALNASANQFYLSKLLEDSMNNLRSESTYHSSAIRYASSFLDRGFPLNPHARSLMAAIGMKGENIKPSQTSMGAHVTNVSSAMSGEGMHYPIGGPRALCHAFQSVIEENDGRVLTHVPIARLIFEDPPEKTSVPTPTAKDGEETKAPTETAPRCIGVMLADKREIKFNMAEWKQSIKPAIVSMMGFINTFIRLVPDEVRVGYTFPRGLYALAESRPVIKILFALDGSAKDLDVTGADFYRLPSAAVARDSINSETGEVVLGEIGGGVADDDKDDDEVKIDEVNHEPVGESHALTSKTTSKPKKSRRVKFEAGRSWMQIAFPSAKDPSFESRHGKITTCVVTVEADDDFVTPFDSKPKMYVIQRGKDETHPDHLWLMQRVQKDLLETYPQLDGKILHSKLVGPLHRGLSHTPERYAAKGVRPDSPYPGLFCGGSDLTVGESFSGSIVGGWLTSNAVMGYTALDHLYLQKNVTSDIARYLEPPDIPNEEDLAVDLDSLDQGITPDKKRTDVEDVEPELENEE